MAEIIIGLCGRIAYAAFALYLIGFVCFPDGSYDRWLFTTSAMVLFAISAIVITSIVITEQVSAIKNARAAYEKDLEILK